jgi:hypothetical protein
MEKRVITKQQARRFILSHQALLPPYQLNGKAGILDFIDKVGCIQFDPLNIVGYNQELVLQSRIGNFQTPMLQQLLYKDRKLVDAWDKNMSIYGISDWPYFKRRRDSFNSRLGNDDQPATAVLPQIRQAIEARGPLSSIDLDHNEKVDWWWAPTSIARAAMESMYFWGELIIHHKVNTRRVFDFSHRHIPKALLSAPDPNETEAQYHDWYVLRRIGAIGLIWGKSCDAWLGMGRIKSQERHAAIARLLEQKKIQEVSVEDIAIPLYMRSEDLPCLDEVLTAAIPLSRAAIIAPLDNLIWERKLIKELFDFEYRWEVYKPVDEGEYGYYVLPILYGDRFIARFEPGWDKSCNTMIIKNWWWEPGVRQNKKMQNALQQCFKHFLRYLETDNLQIEDTVIESAHIGWLYKNKAGK